MVLRTPARLIQGPRGPAGPTGPAGAGEVGDIDSDDVENVSGVEGATVTEALDALAELVGEGGVGATGADGVVNLGHAAFSALVISSNTISLDTTAGGIFSVTLTADVTTVTMANTVSGEANFFTLRVKQDGTGGKAFTNPASWKFSTGAYVVSSAANAADLLQGITYDNGTTWQVSYLRNYV